MNLSNDIYQCDLCLNRKYSVSNSYSRRIGIDHSKLRVVTCSKCGLKSLYPLPVEEDLGLIYEDYVSKGSRDRVEEIRKGSIYPRKLQMLKTHSRGKRLLDIGAGLGTFVYMSRQKGFDAFGIEYEKRQCEMAKLKYGIELINGKFEEISKGFKKGAFDIVHMHHVLEHLFSPRKVLQKIYHLLANNGLLLIEVPNQFDNIFLESRLLLGKKLSKYNNPTQHFYYFSPKTLSAYIKASGFHIISMNQHIRGNETNYFKYLGKLLFEKAGFGVGSFIEVLARKH